MDVTLLGIVTDVREVQYPKAPTPYESNDVVMINNNNNNNNNHNNHNNNNHNNHNNESNDNCYYYNHIMPGSSDHDGYTYIINTTTECHMTW